MRPKTQGPDKPEGPQEALQPSHGNGKVKEDLLPLNKS